MGKKNSVKKILKWVFSGFTIFFISALFIMLFHDLMTGESSKTAEYCAKYGFLASPDCW
jgi:hypothetical protein